MTLAVNLAQGASNNVTFRNRIINGGMVIDQRNAGASVAMTGGIYITDRWRSYASAASKLTAQQSSTASTGFSNSLLFTSQSAYTQSATDEFLVEQRIEGFNTSDLAWGTANAQTVTLSFWVRSSLTGTFSGALSNSAQDRNYPFTFTISTANTFEYKSVTIAGDTSGTWIGSTNGIGIRVKFNLGTGSTYLQTAGAWTASYANGATGSVALVNTNGATLYITGVQLEAGTTASPFEYRQYGTELSLCQRYCWGWRLDSGSSSQLYVRFPVGVAFGSTQGGTYLPMPVQMRTTPSITWSGTWLENINGNATGTAITLGSDGCTPNSAFIFYNATSGTFTNTNQIQGIRINNSVSWYGIFSSEL
jgi:hypothetical protein